jgi:creatinine amidohydrolase
VLPPVSYGYCHHVMDFPGTITIEPSTFVRFLLDITRSLAYHGFKRIIMINGHGSNAHLVEQAGRQTCLQTDALCCTLSWWQLVADYWNKEVRTSPPGGCAHACELETSMYLHLDGAGVRTDRVRGALPEFVTRIEGGDEWQWVDLTAGAGPVSLVEWTSTYSETGSFGAPEGRTPRRVASSSSTRSGGWSISCAGTRVGPRRRAASTTTRPRRSRCRSASEGVAG